MKRRGFTIIETLFVLAISSLLFAVLFQMHRTALILFKDQWGYQKKVMTEMRLLEEYEKKRQNGQEVTFFLDEKQIRSFSSYKTFKSQYGYEGVTLP